MSTGSTGPRSVRSAGTTCSLVGLKGRPRQRTLDVGTRPPGRPAPSRHLQVVHRRRPIKASLAVVGRWACRHGQRPGPTTTGARPLPAPSDDPNRNGTSDQSIWPPSSDRSPPRLRDRSPDLCSTPQQQAGDHGGRGLTCPSIAGLMMHLRRRSATALASAGAPDCPDGGWGARRDGFVASRIPTGVSPECRATTVLAFERSDRPSGSAAGVARKRNGNQVPTSGLPAGAPPTAPQAWSTP